VYKDERGAWEPDKSGDLVEGKFAERFGMHQLGKIKLKAEYNKG